MKAISKVKDHMKSLGLSSFKRMDKYLYATMLDLGAVPTPLELRGTRKDLASGCLWKRKLEFIVKYRYNVNLKDVIAGLHEFLVEDSIYRDGIICSYCHRSKGFNLSFSVKFLLNRPSHILGYGLLRF